MSRVIAFKSGAPSVLPDGFKDNESLLASDLILLKASERLKMESLSLSEEIILRQLATIDSMAADLTSPLVEPKVLAPENPSAFEKTEDDTTAHFITKDEIKLIDLEKEWQPEKSLLEKIKIFFFPPAEADTTQQLPTLADTKEDGKEVVFSPAILELAEMLGRNPVKILNFVRSSITFEPYATSKKNADACLRDRICNDVDTAALTIALFRASGISARYRKSAALLTRAQAESLLGVDNPKSAYYQLSANGRPTYVVGSALQNPDETTLEQADFSSVTHFYTEWVGVEAFVEYDERGGFYENMTDLSGAQNDGEVATLLQPTDKKTWIYMDPSLQATTRSQKPLPSSVDMLSFIETHLKTADTRTPIGHFNAVAGVNVLEPSARTTVTTIDTPYEILPPTPPYNLGEKNDITTEAWSTLPDIFRQRVTVSLKKSDNSLLLTKTIFAYQMHDQEFTLSYQGATPQDQSIIDSYGGIYATPPGLVQIVPVLSDGEISVQGTTPVRIGDTVLLGFLMNERNQNQELITKSNSQMFTIAGNTEGIYMTFSEAFTDAERQSPEQVLLGGNASIARYYVAKFHETQKQLSGVFDQSTVSHFSRAVVTDNRIVSTVNGSPTTFDFQGLTIDAQSAITPGSRRTSHNLNSYGMAVLLAAQLSDYEAGVFMELAGLSAVSTVPGIKYAAARPQEYTVHTLDLSNLSTLDSLQLSQNTKDNMYNDIEDGARVITPNKPVTNEEFTGIVYASLGPTLLRFAIGEQSQLNGGFTSHTFTVIGVSSNAKKVTLSGGNTFVHLEQMYGPQPANCLITSTIAQSITGLPGYSAQDHGQPCYQRTFTFDSKTHTVSLTEKGAYFKVGTAAGYWKTIANITNLMQQKFALNRNNLSNPLLDGKYKFNTAAGTISWAGHHSNFLDLATPDCPRCLTVYYKPAGTQPDDAFTVYGTLLGKLEEQGLNAKIINELGFPTSERIQGGVHDRFGPFDTYGVFQSFVNGEVSMITSPFLRSATYMPGRIADCYFKRNGACSGTMSSGPLSRGYPVSDPKRKNDGKVKQEFQSDAIVWDPATNNVSQEYAAKFLCDEVNGSSPAVMTEAFITGLMDSGISLVTGAMDLLGAIVEADVKLTVFYMSSSYSEIGQRFLDAIKSSPSFISTIASSASQDVKQAITSAECPARQLYLVARYAPDVIAAVKAAEGAASAAGRLASRVGLVGDNAAALTAIRSTAASEISAKGATDALLDTFRQKSAQAFDDVVVEVQRQGTTLNSTALTAAERQASYGWAYDDALKAVTQDFKINGATRISKIQVEHVIYGEKGSFLNGGHFYEGLERKIVNGVVEAATDINGVNRISSLSNPTVRKVNGVREVYVRVPRGTTWKLQSVLPKGANSNDVFTKAIDILDTTLPVGGDPLRFEKLVTIAGDEGTFTFNLRAVRTSASSPLLKTTYPVLP